MLFPGSRFSYIHLWRTSSSTWTLNVGSALKTAHTSFSMGIAGTEVAKEVSATIFMDDNFASNLHGGAVQVVDARPSSLAYVLMYFAVAI